MKKFIFLILILLSYDTILNASYKDALDLFEKKMYVDSLKTIASELDISKDMEPDSPNYNLRFLAAHDHWKMGNFESAVIHLKRCADIKKDSPDPLIDLSLLMLDFKRYGDARYFARQALKFKDNPVSYYVTGKCNFFFGRYSRSKTDFEKAISLNPEFAEAYNSLGILLTRLKKFSEAGTAFAAAQALMPGSADVLNNVALNFENQGDFQSALDSITKANELDPGNKMIQKNMNRLKSRINVN